jgi:hypothetical protein
MAADSDIAAAGAGVPDYPGVVVELGARVVVVELGIVVVVVDVVVVDVVVPAVVAVALPALVRPLVVGVWA